MKASLRSVRIAPKKANLVAKMVRGKSVPDALHLLEHVNKKAARILEDLVRSAIANASHNDKQDPQMMVIKTLTVNKAQSFHRGVPMARGRIRPMRKFLSHIELRLGIEGDAPAKKEEPKKEETKKKASQPAAKPVQKTATSAKKTSTKGKSTKPSSAKAADGKKDTAASTSKSSVSKKSSPTK